MSDLQQLRSEIDRIDTEMAELFQKRMEIVEKVAEYKKENNIETQDNTREAKVIELHIDQITDRFKSSYTKFMKQLFKISRSYQDNLRDQ